MTQELRLPANSGPHDYSARPGEAIRVSRTPAGDFAIGNGRITIAAAEIRFVAAVVADLGRIVHTREGLEVIRKGDALGRSVAIAKPDPPTDPPNGWICPDDPAAAVAAGTGTGSAIVYDPADWPWPGDSQSPTSEMVLLAMLHQANRNAAGEGR